MTFLSRECLEQTALPWIKMQMKIIQMICYLACFLSFYTPGKWISSCLQQYCALWLTGSHSLFQSFISVPKINTWVRDIVLSKLCFGGVVSRLSHECICIRSKAFALDHNIIWNALPRTERNWIHFQTVIYFCIVLI